MLTKQPVYVVDVIDEVVQQTSIAITPKLQLIKPQITGVHYLVGHFTEIQNRLIKKKDEKYPLICLFQDFVETRGVKSGYYADVPLQLMIVYYTNSDEYTESRYDKVFKPILYPIYTEFIHQLGKHRLIVTTGVPSHQKIDRPNWADRVKSENKLNNTFPDALDGIEIQLTKLTIKQKC